MWLEIGCVEEKLKGQCSRWQFFHLLLIFFFFLIIWSMFYRRSSFLWSTFQYDPPSLHLLLTMGTRPGLFYDAPLCLWWHFSTLLMIRIIYWLLSWFTSPLWELIWWCSQSIHSSHENLHINNEVIFYLITTLILFACLKNWSLLIHGRKNRINNNTVYLQFFNICWSKTFSWVTSK